MNSGRQYLFAVAPGDGGAKRRWSSAPSDARVWRSHQHGAPQVSRCALLSQVLQPYLVLKQGLQPVVRMRAGTKLPGLPGLAASAVVRLNVTFSPVMRE